jgi:hypothetical protein
MRIVHLPESRAVTFNASLGFFQRLTVTGCGANIQTANVEPAL